LPVPRPPETWSGDDENEGGVKFNDEGQQCLPTENQYDVDPLFESSCSSTEPHLISPTDLRHLACDRNFQEIRIEHLSSKLKVGNL
jgi:hypothetical protein